MGSLAHNANMRHGANTANKQGAPQAGIPQPGPPPQQASTLLEAAGPVAIADLLKDSICCQTPLQVTKYKGSQSSAVLIAVPHCYKRIHVRGCILSASTASVV